VKELVFFIEEESAKSLLAGLCQRLIPPASQVAARFVVFEGKRDLDKQLERKLRGYLNPHARFIILRDKDGLDCHEVKRSLVSPLSGPQREFCSR